MSKNFSGKQYKCIVGKQDLSAVALGTATTGSSMVSGTNLFMELDTVNPINYDGMIQQNATLKIANEFFIEVLAKFWQKTCAMGAENNNNTFLQKDSELMKHTNTYENFLF